MSIWKFLGLSPPDRGPDEPDETGAVRKIARELDQLEPQRAKFIAAFAYVLSRVARADMHVSDDETRAMERIVMETGGLPEAQAVLVVQIAKSHSLLFGGTENYRVSKEFAKQASRDERLALVRCLFEVSAADLSISTTESHVIRQIAGELNLEHHEFIAVQSAYSEHRAVLKKPESAED